MSPGQLQVSHLRDADRLRRADDGAVVFLRHNLMTEPADPDTVALLVDEGLLVESALGFHRTPSALGHIRGLRCRGRST